jgi:hypothetical protein
MKGIPTIPGEPCHVEALPSWSLQEKWVWKKICLNEVADFNKENSYGGTLYPKESQEWPENRILTSEFLETIILHEPYSGAIPHQGIRIIGAWLNKPLDLSNSNLEHQLILTNSRFDSYVNLSSLKTPYSISLAGSKFKDKLIMSRLNVGENLYIGNGAEYDGEVVINEAKINGSLSMIGSRFTREFKRQEFKRGQFFNIDKSKLSTINI